MGTQPHSELVQLDRRLTEAVDAALADAAIRAGAHLVCRPGCTPCCHGAFAIRQLDALRLQQGLAELSHSDPEKAGAVVERAGAYLVEFGPDFPGNLRTGRLGESAEERAAFEEFANDAPCPVLDPATGLCELYQARPMTCRTFGPPVKMRGFKGSEGDENEGFGVCELCFTDAVQAEIAAAEMVVPYDQEEFVLETLGRLQPEMGGETIIACCLVAQPPGPPSTS